MKRMKFILLATLFVVSFKTEAQVSVNVNIGTPPVWAPRNALAVHYYYLPDIEVYYDVPARRYIYMRNGNWFRSAALPAQYRNYNLYHGRTVYITNYRGNYPYYYFKQHKVKYHKSNNNAYQKSNGNGNYKGNNHDNGNGNYEGNKHDNGNGNGNNHGNEKKQGKGKK
jgi:hypothetical protein